VSTVKDTAMVTTALKMALWRRDHGGRRVGDGLIHHSDAGSQYTSIPVKKLLTTCRWRRPLAARAARFAGDLEFGVAADGSVSGR